MDTACDMSKPIGYWVQQTRSGGETIAVKVLLASLSQAYSSVSLTSGKQK